MSAITILDLVVCALMFYRVSEYRLSPLSLLLTVPLALTLGNMWRRTMCDLMFIGAAGFAVSHKASERVSSQD